MSVRLKNILTVVVTHYNLACGNGNYGNGKFDGVFTVTKKRNFYTDGV